MTSSTTLTFPPDMATTFLVNFNFLQDSLTQELDETVVLSFVATENPLIIGTNTVLFEKLTLVIIDADGKEKHYIRPC